jgi:hypothetical protein
VEPLFFELIAGTVIMGWDKHVIGIYRMTMDTYQSEDSDCIVEEQHRWEIDFVADWVTGKDVTILDSYHLWQVGHERLTFIECSKIVNKALERTVSLLCCT